MQDAAGMDPGDRAAAGADAVDVQAVERNCMTRDPAPACEARLTADNQRNVGAGSAHIERDQIALAEQTCRINAAGNSAGQAGKHCAGCEPAGIVEWGNPAMRLDGQARATLACLGDATFE